MTITSTVVDGIWHPTKQMNCFQIFKQTLTPPLLPDKKPANCIRIAYQTVVVGKSALTLDLESGTNRPETPNPKRTYRCSLRVDKSDRSIFTLNILSNPHS